MSTYKRLSEAEFLEERRQRDEWFGTFVKAAREHWEKRASEPIPGKSEFTVAETAELTGNEAYMIVNMIRDQEIRAINPTGMQWLIPREEVRKIMAGNIEE